MRKWHERLAWIRNLPQWENVLRRDCLLDGWWNDVKLKKKKDFNFKSYIKKFFFFFFFFFFFLNYYHSGFCANGCTSTLGGRYARLKCPGSYRCCAKYKDVPEPDFQWPLPINDGVLMIMIMIIIIIIIFLIIFKFFLNRLSTLLYTI